MRRLPNVRNGWKADIAKRFNALTHPGFQGRRWLGGTSCEAEAPGANWMW